MPRACARASVADAVLLTTISSPDDPLLAAFHAGLYLEEFAAQREPLSAWQRALRGEAPYQLRVQVVVEESIVAGICYERYPISGCGLVTYMVVAQSHRRRGLGQQLQHAAVAELGGVVFGEIVPSKLDRNLRWGARVVDIPYVQPSLGLGRDRGLYLIVLEATRQTLPGSLVRGFLEEFYMATEGGPPDPAIVIGDTVPLILAPPTAAR